MPNFKEGQKVKILKNCIDCVEGEIATLHYGSKGGDNKEYLFAWGKGENANCSCEKNWELVKEEKTLENLEVGDLVERDGDLRRVLAVIPNVEKNYVLTFGWKKGEDEETETSFCCSVKELKRWGFKPYTPPQITELTLKQIADKFGLKEGEIRIKE